MGGADSIDSVDGVDVAEGLLEKAIFLPSIAGPCGLERPRSV
jgi:hypothetical protein